MRRLPPLNALRAFEAAARHLSFAKAAEELNVTPAAISHQVKALEEHCGVKLFRRLTRALLLTDAGQAALPGLREGFDKLAEAAERLRDVRPDNVLTISVAPSFGAKWLVPRLDSFRSRHPEVEIRIDATDHTVDFSREAVDVGLRYGRGRYSGLRADALLTEQTTPVCSPRLLEGQHPLRNPEDLRHHTLLHVTWQTDQDSEPNWRMWLLAAGVQGIDPTRGPSFSQETMAIQAAIDGQGVALAGHIVAGDDLAAGRLVKPFELSLCDPVDFGYYLVSPEEAANQPKVAAFRDWILDEVRAAS